MADHISGSVGGTSACRAEHDPGGMARNPEDRLQSLHRRSICAMLSVPAHEQCIAEAVPERLDELFAYARAKPILNGRVRSQYDRGSAVLCPPAQVDILTAPKVFVEPADSCEYTTTYSHRRGAAKGQMTEP